MSWRALQKLRAPRLLCSLSARREVWRHGWKAGEKMAAGRRALTVSSWKYADDQTTHDQTTHTGQKWESDDFRNIRFVDREKQVNEQFAISLLAEEPVVAVKDTHTWCDGGGGALGHPKIYINLDKPEINDCGYCGKRFVAEQNKNLFPKENFATEK